MKTDLKTEIMTLRIFSINNQCRNGRDLHCLINWRANTRAAIEKHRTSRGTIFIVEHGRDCDGVVYDGRVSEIEGTFEAFQAEEDRRAEWADGPFGLYIVSEEEAKHIHYTWHDTFAEAAGY